MNRSRDFRTKARRFDRTQRPPRYYLIDFRWSRQYNTRDALDLPPQGKSAPENRLSRWCNPFRADIYFLGNLVRVHFMKVNLFGLVCFVAYLTFQEYNGFGFMEGLVDSMMLEYPGTQPRIEEIIEEFSRIRGSLSADKLRSPITPRNDPSIISAFRYTSQAIRTIRYTISEKPAIPDPITDNWGCLGKGIYFIVEVETYVD